MTDLLVFSSVTDRMAARLDRHFTYAVVSEVDLDAFLERDGAKVRFVLTDGPTGVPTEVLERLPQLEVISNIGVGYDAVPTARATERGIPVCHTPGVLSEDVATTAVMLFLTLWRNFEAEMIHARSGRWATEGHLPLPRSADNRTVGILGLGRIGKAIAAKLAPWNTEIHYHGRHAQDVPYRYHADLVAMARICDTLICVAPGGEETYHLIDREVIEAIGPEGYLINVGRGSTVDEAALIAALEAGRIGGAGLDVFENEPHISDALRRMPNVVMLPHVASASVETRHAMHDLAIDNLIAWKEGRPLLSPVPESAAIL